ncbi:MAG: PAS domain-containing protein [Deltaproteobacteria bacterium]|nr:PAS domain-containing protein [Deltaproteobacteria bacterium]
MVDRRVADDQLHALAAELALTRAQLRATRGRLFEVLENGAEMVFVKDLDGRYEFINDAGAALLGLTPGEVIGATDREIFEPDVASEIAAQDRRVVATGETLAVRVRRPFPDGPHDLVTHKWPWRDDEGRIVGVVGVTRDATDEDSARREAAELAIGMSHVVDALPDVVLVYRDEVVLHVNPVALSVLRRAEGELVGAPLGAVIRADDLDRLLQLRQGTLSGGSSEFLLDLPDGSGVLLDVRDVAVPWYGSPARLLVGRDITARRRSEAQLASTDRMAVLGLLASGIAHEIKNPLTFVLNRVVELEARAGGADRIALADIRDAAERIAVIVRDVSGFARPDDAEAPVADVEAVIDRAVVLARSRLKGVKVTREKGARRPARVGERRLCQVLLNLLVNAAQAVGSGSGGSIIIQTSDDGRAVVIRVRDNGPGVPVELAARIFEPFVTTKEIGEGTGLGLWLSQSIVEGLGGRLLLENPGLPGACFALHLPVSTEPMPTRTLSLPGRAGSSRSRSAAAPSRPVASRPRLLVVDDEPMIADLVAMGLSDQFEVVYAEGVLPAIASLQAAGRFDLVLCDLMMPDGGGARVHAQIMSISSSRPKMVFMSGGAADAEARRFIAEWRIEIVEKPFRLAELRLRLLAALRA